MAAKTVSIVMPIHNSAEFLDEALASVVTQTIEPSKLELSVVDDASSDESWTIFQKWRPQLEARNIAIVASQNHGPKARGCGWATNQAILQSSGRFICLMDSDDVSEKERIEAQLDRMLEEIKTNNMSEELPPILVGANFYRRPEGSTERYTSWLNRLNDGQLMTQRFVECTIVKPSWFFARTWFEKVGMFDEGGKGVPEDMIFFYRHIQLGGRLCKIAHPHLMYRYHQNAGTLAVTEMTIFTERLKAFELEVLSKWCSFTIWNAGKLGRRFYRALSSASQQKVSAFCDVDERKITHGSYFVPGVMKEPIPIQHFSHAKPPLVLCVKLDMTGGEFESNLASLNLREGHDYFHFC